MQPGALGPRRCKPHLGTIVVENVSGGGSNAWDRRRGSRKAGLGCTDLCLAEMQV